MTSKTLPRRIEPLQCSMIDGTKIACMWYPVEGPAPAIIMSHGFNCIKEMTLPETAEAFQCHGYHALLYDGRSIGESGGKPQNLIDPLQMAEDLIDISTYVSSLPGVDGNRIALWGMSFGAVVSACAAAIDRRPRALVMVCPLLSYVLPKKAERAYAMLIKDRVSQFRGNEAASVAPFTSHGDNLIGMGGAGGPGGLEAFGLMKAAAAKGPSHFRDRVSLQTYHKLAMFQPMAYMHMIKADVLMVIPEKDTISPLEQQREAYEKIQSTKRLHLAQSKGHLDIATGAGAAELVKATCSFLEESFNGTLDRASSK